MKFRAYWASAAVAACLSTVAASDALAQSAQVVSAHTASFGAMSRDANGAANWLIEAGYDQEVEFSIEEVGSPFSWSVTVDGNPLSWLTYTSVPAPWPYEFGKGSLRFTAVGGQTSALKLSVFFPAFCDCTNHGTWELKPVAAVPEPATYALMVAGLAAMGLVARRKSG